MKPLKYRITFKILIGYIILGISLTFFGGLVLSEIKTFTQLQEQDVTDKNNILNVGSLIADIYENEGLARAAIQLNSSKKFNEYLKENERLLLKIDSLNFSNYNTSQGYIFDSIKVVINKKLKNIIDLKKVKHSYNSDESINTVINKLSSIDSLLNKAYIDNLLKNADFLNIQTRMKYRKLKRMLEKNNLKDSISIDQKKIDSLISVSKGMLRKTQKATLNQRLSLLKKERELVENDIIISRKLRELLNTLKKGVITHTNKINKQREKTRNRSRQIILLAVGIIFFIIIIFSITFLNDFWKSQRYRKQLEKANKTTSSLLKSREQLISMVSHDLRTPLSTITGYSELLQKSVQNTKEENYIEHIWNASAYMKQLVDDLMEFSKIESGTISFKSVPFNLEKNINEIILNTQNFIKDKPVNFEVKHDDKIKYPIISDPFRMKQILYNLITNACKFTNKGTITIKSILKQENNKNIIEISVTDTGIGIPKNQQKTIFKEFTQVETTTKENNKNGFGLGLTISKKLAELLKGKLTLKSEIGKGSVFTLKIPVTLSDKPLNTVKTNDVVPIFNLTALIVEDDASIRQLLQDILKQYHIKCTIFSNAQEALKNIETIYYDFILTDIQLPKMNGIRFMELLKNHKSYNNQPIIAMTGRLNLSKEDYINIGFSGVLPKPFNTLELQNMLHQFFESDVSETKTLTVIDEKTVTEGFNLTSLKMFLNNDNETINKTLSILLEDTKKNSLFLKQAKMNNDIHQFNTISHTMLGMFKQLDVHKITPFLTNFETTTVIEDALFIDFKKELNIFIDSLENYLS